MTEPLTEAGRTPTSQEQARAALIRFVPDSWDQERVANFLWRLDEYARAIEQQAAAQPSGEALRLLRDVEGAAEREIAMFQRTGAVFDKWPAKGHEGPWTDEQLAGLDAETRWQGIAFSVYTTLADLSGKARSALQTSAAEGPTDE